MNNIEMYKKKKSSNIKVSDVQTFFINGGFCIEARFVCFLIKMAADKEAFVLDFV